MKHVFAGLVGGGGTRVFWFSYLRGTDRAAREMRRLPEHLIRAVEQEDGRQLRGANRETLQIGLAA